MSELVKVLVLDQINEIFHSESNGIKVLIKNDRFTELEFFFQVF